MHFLALDIGTKRTGVAYCDEDVGIPFPLETIKASSRGAWLERVLALVTERKIDRVFVGLPRLPSGAEGSQAGIVREYTDLLEERGISVVFVDERYTTPRKSKMAKERDIPERETDADAAAACEILRISGKC